MAQDFRRQVMALWRQIHLAEHMPSVDMAALDRAWIALWRQATTAETQTLCTQLEEAIQALNDVKARRERR